MSVSPIKFDYVLRSELLWMPSVHYVKELNRSKLFSSRRGVTYPHTNTWDEEIKLKIIDDVRALSQTECGDVLILSDIYWELFFSPQLRIHLLLLFKRYKYIVQFIKEPQFGELGTRAMRCGTTGENLFLRHLDFLDDFKPDLVVYPSLVDMASSPAKDVALHTGMIDTFMDYSPQKPSPENIKKRKDFIFGGTIKGWEHVHKYTKVNSINNIVKYLDKEGSTLDLLDTKRHDVYPLDYKKMSHKIRNYKYQLDLPNGFHFHFFRSLQSWFNNVIPFVIVPKKNEEEFEKYYGDFPCKSYENCIIANEDNLNKKLKEALDPELALHLLKNIDQMNLHEFSAKKMIETIHDKITNKIYS